MTTRYTARDINSHGSPYGPSESQGEVVLHTQVRPPTDAIEIRKLTPFGLAATPGFVDKTTWQSTEFPKMTRIIVPANSAIGSRNHCL